MNEWVYLINDRHPEWGYDVTAVEFCGGDRDPGMHAWTLARFLKDMAPGDYLWIRATLPLGAFIGLGQVATDLQPDAYGATFGVVFDDDISARMAANPIHGVLEKHTQTPRLLTPTEARTLHRRAGALPKASPVPLGRIKRLQDVVARQGQQQFRAQLMAAYNGQCAVTASDVPEVLQAAHIQPYDGTPTNVLPNGLLLRADIHDLFDRGLLWITPSMRIAIAPHLKDSAYAEFKGRKLRQPSNPSQRPDPHRVRQHRTVIAGQDS